jgi:cytochrome c
LNAHFYLSYQNRWLLIEFIPAISTPGHDYTRIAMTTRSPDAISGKDVFNALKQSVLQHFGDVGRGEKSVRRSQVSLIFVFLLPRPPVFRPAFLQGADLVPVARNKSSISRLSYGEPLHRTRCARHGNKHDLASARVA